MWSSNRHEQLTTSEGFCEVFHVSKSYSYRQGVVNFPLGKSSTCEAGEGQQAMLTGLCW